MIILDNVLRAWQTAGFEEVLKSEIARLGPDGLPLQQGLSKSSRVSDEPVTVMINRVNETEAFIRVRAGIFYSGTISGCSCADDPTPPGEINEYCEVQLDIDKSSAQTKIELIEDR